MLIKALATMLAVIIDIFSGKKLMKKPVLWVSPSGGKPEKRSYDPPQNGACRISRNSNASMRYAGHAYHILDNGKDTVMRRKTVLTLSDSGERIAAKKHRNFLPVTTFLISALLILRLIFVPVTWHCLTPAYRSMSFCDLDYHWVPEDELSEQERKTEDNIYNLLVIGTDGRNSLEPRSDVMMLISVNHETRKISIISILRDLGVYAYDPSAQTFQDVVNEIGLSADDPNFKIYREMMQNGSHYRFMKLNETFSLTNDSFVKDGMSAEEAKYAGSCRSLLMNIEYTLGIRIDNYVAVDFTAVKDLVDAVGGIDINIPFQEYVDALNGVLSLQNDLFQASDSFCDTGTQKLNGNQALAYLRLRHVGNWSDAERSARQRQFLKTLLKQCALHMTSIDTEYLKQACTNVTTNLSEEDAYMLYRTLISGFYTLQYDQTIPQSNKWDDYSITYRDGSTISYVYVPSWMTPLDEQIREVIYQDTKEDAE